MICKLKTLTLALAAVLALGAVSASMASAQQQGFGTSEGPVTLKGTENAAGVSITAFGALLSCPGSTYTGHKILTYPETESKAHELLGKLFTTATITPHINQAACKAAGVPATIDMNKCDYQILLGVTTGGVEHTYGVTFSIVCPAGSEITITTYLNPADHAAEKKQCVLHIPQQFGLAGAHLQDTTNGFLDLNGTVKGIKVKRTKGGVACPVEQETTTGELHLDVKVGGYTAGGAGTALGISE